MLARMIFGWVLWAVCGGQAMLGGFGYQQPYPPMQHPTAWGHRSVQPLFTYQQPSFYGVHGMGPFGPRPGQPHSPHQAHPKKKRNPDCLVKSCRTLGGFKRCLSAKGEPYSPFIFAPEEAQTRKAHNALGQFVRNRPRCYLSFCRSICGGLIKRGENRQKGLRKRQQIAALCKESSEEGAQLRMLCSRCRDVTDGDQIVMGPCQVQILRSDKDGILKVESIVSQQGASVGERTQSEGPQRHKGRASSHSQDFGYDRGDAPYGEIDGYAGGPYASSEFSIASYDSRDAAEEIF